MYRNLIWYAVNRKLAPEIRCLNLVSSSEKFNLEKIVSVHLKYLCFSAKTGRKRKCKNGTVKATVSQFVLPLLMIWNLQRLYLICLWYTEIQCTRNLCTWLLVNPLLTASKCFSASLGYLKSTIANKFHFQMNQNERFPFSNARVMLPIIDGSCI